MSVISNSKEAMVQARTRMEKAVEDFRKDLAGVRTGRANVALLDHIRVDYHGTPMPVNQLGTLSVPEPMLIVISPWDPTAVALIDKAIRTSDLGLNPTNDGKVVRVPIPPLTQDRRNEIAKNLRKDLEKHKTAVRNVRHDIKEAVDKLEKRKRSARTSKNAPWMNWKKSPTPKPKKSKTSAP